MKARSGPRGFLQYGPFDERTEHREREGCSDGSGCADAKEGIGKDWKMHEKGGHGQRRSSSWNSQAEHGIDQALRS